MALKKIIEVQGDAYVNSAQGSVNLGNQRVAFTAYCKIVAISGNKENGKVIIECSSDNSSITKQENVPFSVEENAPNFIKQAYLHLKTLPEWADAIDC